MLQRLRTLSDSRLLAASQEGGTEMEVLPACVSLQDNHVESMAVNSDGRMAGGSVHVDGEGARWRETCSCFTDRKWSRRRFLSMRLNLKDIDETRRARKLFVSTVGGKLKEILSQ